MYSKLTKFTKDMCVAVAQGESARADCLYSEEYKRKRFPLAQARVKLEEPQLENALAVPAEFIKDREIERKNREIAEKDQEIRELKRTLAQERSGKRRAITTSPEPEEHGYVADSDADLSDHDQPLRRRKRMRRKSTPVEQPNDADEDPYDPRADAAAAAGPAQHVCEVVGCGQAFNSERGLGLHFGKVHARKSTFQLQSSKADPPDQPI